MSKNALNQLKTPYEDILLKHHKPTIDYGVLGEEVNKALTPRDMLSFINACTSRDGLVKHNIQGYNDLINKGINKIMTTLVDINRVITNERDTTEADRKRSSFQIQISFHNVKVGMPTCTGRVTGATMDLYPGNARLAGLPYSGQITLSATVTLTANNTDGTTDEKVIDIPPFQIGGFPTMIGSINCHTTNYSRAGLKELGEDPTDSGGYFIAKGQEYVIDLLENIRYNVAHLFKKMRVGELVRAEMISQPGGAFENSAMFRVRYMANGQITVEIISIKFEKLRLPFFLIYRLFGMTSDKDIAETIVFDINDTSPTTIHMLEIIKFAFQQADAVFAPMVNELDRAKLAQMTAEKVINRAANGYKTYQNNENAIRFLIEELLGTPGKSGGFDRMILPHMGQDIGSRIKKLRFLGLIIHKMLLVHFDVLPQTDRDSFRNKRVHGAGTSMAKAFKTHVNNIIVMPIFNAVKRELKTNSWDSITNSTIEGIFANMLSISDLHRALEQSITSGSKLLVIKNKTTNNRISSQLLERKNPLNVYSSLRSVVTQNSGNPSKGTERADLMRRVHPSYVGYICIIQSVGTGERVGMHKQLAVTAGVCTAGEELPLKLHLLSDPSVISLDIIISSELLRNHLSRIYINGEWIGVCSDSFELVKRYRRLRREGNFVDAFTTIYLDPITNEIEFCLDVGRLYRPLLIVDNNILECNAVARIKHMREGKFNYYLEDRIVELDGTNYDLKAVLAVCYNKPIQKLSADTLLVSATIIPSQPIIDDHPIILHFNGEKIIILDGRRRLAGAASTSKKIVSAIWIEKSELQYCVKDIELPEVEFSQNMRFTADHIRKILSGVITIEDLVSEGVAEYITAEESENCLLARSFEVLKQDVHDITMQYTHCDVEQAIMGLAALISPYGNHTQPSRVTFETTQARQTCGWYALNYPFRKDKNRCIQFYNEVPLVSTFTHKFVPANGANVIIAYSSYGGDNQEDSAIINQSSVKRGLFDSVYRKYERLELEKGQIFATPDPITTKAIKITANYEKLVNGLIRVGSTIVNGDVLIGRIEKLNRSKVNGDEKYTHTDRSLVYKQHEPAYVEDVLLLRDADDQQFCVVKLRYEREFRVGDKLSSRSGNKSIGALLLPESDMPFTETGLVPDFIVNTHCIPSRMTIGQLMESMVGMVCACKGTIADGTAFLPIDMLDFAQEMQDLGLRYNGRHRMYNGMTGQYMDAAIFMGICLQQRLQKFVLDEEQSVGNSAPTDATTGQPLSGKHVHGGLRIGEMENWGLASHGSILNMFEKNSKDSDGRKAYVCRTCGHLAAYNKYQDSIYMCRRCGELADISAIECTKSSVLFMEELAAGNIQLKLGLQPREFGGYVDDDTE